MHKYKLSIFTVAGGEAIHTIIEAESEIDAIEEVYSKGRLYDCIYDKKTQRINIDYITNITASKYQGGGISSQNGW